MIDLFRDGSATQITPERGAGRAEDSAPVSARPVYAVTGKGHPQSEGVGTLQKIKRSLKQRREKTVA